MLLVKSLAVFVTITASFMAAVAGWDRGGTVIDRGLLVALSVAVILAVHLLPALSRRPAAWLVWAFCFMCAIYGHLTFFTHASLRAGEARAQQSALTVGTERQIKALETALETVRARPIALVSAQLAQTKGSRERAALREEIAEGRRAELLRTQLANLYAVSTKAQVEGTVDPVASRLAQVFGVSESQITIIVGMVFAILLELIGTILWFEALKKHATVPATEAATPALPGATVDTPAGTEDITALFEAVKAGKIKPTLRDIRVFMNCSQEKAMKLRRELLGLNT